MKTFKQYAEERLAEDSSAISGQIMKAGNAAAAKNPKVVPGLTPPNLIKQTLISDPGVEKLVAQDPTSAGAIGAYLGGPAAAKQLGVKTNMSMMKSR